MNYNNEAEQSVLGAMMIDSSAWKAAQPLKAEHFFIKAHGVIYNAISQVISDDKHPDPVVLAGVLGDRFDDMEYLYALQQCVPSSKNAEGYAEIIRDKFKERQLLEACDDVKNIVEQDIPVDKKIDAASGLFMQIGKESIRKMPREILEISLERTQHYQDLQSGKVEPGWTTRLTRLDFALTGGLKPGKLIVIAGRPGMGKSSLSSQLVETTASYGLPSLFCSMEMSEGEVADRVVSNMARVNYSNLMSGNLSDDDWERAAQALEEMRCRPLFIDDQESLTLTDIKLKVRSIEGVKVVVVDYIQLCQGVGNTRNESIGSISRGLKALAKELGICVIALSQLNREVDKRANRKPTMSDLRESGEIEQDADVIMFLYPVRELPSRHQLIGLYVAKNRMGQTCEIALDFDGSVQSWHESLEPIYQQTEEKTYTRGFA